MTEGEIQTSFVIPKEDRDKNRNSVEVSLVTVKNRRSFVKKRALDSEKSKIETPSSAILREDRVKNCNSERWKLRRSVACCNLEPLKFHVVSKVTP